MSRRLPLVLLLLISACSSPHPASRDPIGLQILRADPELKSERFSLLLDFESDMDQLFVSGGGPTTLHPHTGDRALLATKGITTFDLPSLLSGRPFPGEWTLVGLHVRPTDGPPGTPPTTVTLAYFDHDKPVSNRTITCMPGAWTALYVEITPSDADPAMAPHTGPGTLAIEASAPVEVDDVLLVNNSRSYVPDKSAWTVRRRGYALLLDRPGAFHAALPTPDVSPAKGWRVDTATPLRARLSRGSGDVTMTVYNDGRAFRSDASPPPVHGQVSLPDDQGRVDRNSPGDVDNDGFNETRGAYRVIARGKNLDITLTPPASTPIDRPVLEIDHLPAGNILATVEGRPATQIDREGDTAVIIVPAQIERQTTINVRVE